MGKKIYNKPEIIKTDVDCLITLQCNSANADCPPPQVPDPADEIFINPFKWFK